jgi:hypothetical protein
MAKKDAGTGTPPNKGAQLSPIEQRARDLLTEDEEGNIDNVFDIMDDLTEIEEELPQNSPLRAEWNTFYESCMEIAANVG